MALPFWELVLRWRGEVNLSELLRELLRELLCELAIASSPL
ncbi:hypothetical protein [Pseudanabaena sp. UWO310]|nr:hypothetical protein [Pseudanabaena sp. UWO310]